MSNLPPDGSRVAAMTYESPDNNLPSRHVEGRLTSRYVSSLRYTQCLVDGMPVDPDTIRPLPSRNATESLLEHAATPPRPGWVWDESRKHWVSSKTDPGSADVRTSAPEHPDAEHVLSGLHDLVGAIAPKAAAKSGLMHRIGDAAITAAASVNSFLLRHHDQLDAIGSVLGAVLDMPADLKKFGYEPTASGVTLTGTSDALRAHAGIGTHLACTIASHVLAKALTWARGRMRGESLESTGGAWGYELAETMHDLFVKVNAALGLSGVPSIEEIAQGIQELAKG